MSRRRAWIALAVTAVAALLLGGLTAWWRTAPTRAPDAAVAALFERSFPDADGREQPLSQWRGRHLVVNFWATWCAPCVEEMPALQAVRNEYESRGVEIVGIGIDRADKIRDFRAKLELTLPLLVAGAGGSELGRSLGNSAGVLPFTILITPDGAVGQRRIGQISPEQLRGWLDARLNSVRGPG